MEIARRDLLCITAAVAVSAVTSSCTDGRGNARGTSGPSPGRATEPSRTAGPTTFPGQPAPGALYYGASVPHHRSLPAWESTLGSPLALNRSYFTPDHNETAQLIRRCGDDLAHGRLPHVSIKPARTWQDMATGGGDDWLAGIFGPLGAESAPVFFTLHHEPENDAGATGMRPSDFVEMQHRAIRIAADLAPQVTIVPVLQHWTFDPLHDDSDPKAWIVPEASVMGLDIYNPWSQTNGKEWRTFGSKIDEVIGWFGDTPLAIGEYGCREDSDVPGLAGEWLRDAADYARAHNIVSMSYFNSGVDSPDGTWALRGTTEQTFAELLASPWVTRPT